MLANNLIKDGYMTPTKMSKVINEGLTNNYNIDKPLEGPCYPYTFKIDSQLHNRLKLKAFDLDLSMSDVGGRYIARHFLE